MSKRLCIMTKLALTLRCRNTLTLVNTCNHRNRLKDRNDVITSIDEEKIILTKYNMPS